MKWQKLCVGPFHKSLEFFPNSNTKFIEPFLYKTQVTINSNFKNEIFKQNTLILILTCWELTEGKYWESSYSVIKHCFCESRQFEQTLKTLPFLTLALSLHQDVAGTIQWHHWAWRHAHCRVYTPRVQNHGCSEVSWHTGACRKKHPNALHVWFQIDVWHLHILLLLSNQLCDPQLMGLRSWDLQSIATWSFVTEKEIRCSWNVMDLFLATHFIKVEQCSPPTQPKALFFVDQMPPFQINRAPCYRMRSKKAMSTNENTWNSLPSWSCFVIN